MRTNKNTITQPELFVDDHHGRYMGQIAWQQLADFYKQQALKVLSAETIASLEAGPQDEWHCDACDRLMDVEFKSATGQKLYLTYAEGGIWVISACFLRSKQAHEFFGN